jgi:hypothetical protein
MSVTLIGWAFAASFAHPSSEVHQRPHITLVKGHQLYEACASPAPNDALCVAYVTGFIDGAELKVAAGAERTFCLPRESNAGQYQAVVTKHLQENPATRHYPASYLTQNALSAAFPCRGVLTR